MSGARREATDELHMLAGEYVLGVLGTAERRAVDRKADVDPQLAGAIAGWERRLSPMLTAVSEVAPPAALWARIEHAKSLAPDERQDVKPPPRLAVVPSTMARPSAEPARPWRGTARRVWPWRAATGVSLALAAGLAAIVLLPSQARRPTEPMPGARDVALVAVLAQPEKAADTRQDAAPQMAADTGIGKLIEPTPDTSDPARGGRVAGFLAASWPDGTVVLTAFAPLQVPSGKALELWIQPPDATAPRSLGVLPAAGRQALLPTMPVAGTALSVSLEPPGGSRTGAPTGRIVYAGTLRQIRR